MDTTNLPFNYQVPGKNTADVGCNSLIRSNGLKRQRITDINENFETVLNTQRKCFIHFTINSGVYQTDVLKQSRDGDTIYLPLQGDVFVNLDRAEEITFAEGKFFIGDQNGIYCNSMGGTAMNIWRYSDARQQMIISRSFLITEPVAFNNVKELLLRL